MITNISWGTYVQAIALTTIVYYIVIAIMYYRPEIQQLLKGKSTSFHDLPNNKTEPQFGVANPELYPVALTLMGELDEVIDAASKSKYSKQELMYGLQIRLRGYTNLTHTPFQESVSEYIKKESLQRCSLHLSADEVEALWLTGEDAL